jgi:SAM-dependent methyltransferase
MDMITRTCPLCGSSDTSRVFADADFEMDRLDSFAFASRKMPEYMHYRLIECPTCDLLYANPLPHDDFLAAGYGEAAFDSGVEAHYAAVTYAKALSTFIARLPDRRGALDIGTGDGAFLENLIEQDFDGVIGVEPSRAPIAAARADVRPFIRKGIFRGEDFAQESFSLVTCFQTLEHLNDPLKMILAVKKLLKPGGAAFFICHDRRALSARLLGRKSPIFDIEHLQLFSPRCVRYLLEQSGFCDSRVMTVINRYPLRYWLRLLPLPRGVKQLLIAAFDRLRIDGMSMAIPAGNMAFVGFKPYHPPLLPNTEPTPRALP